MKKVYGGLEKWNLPTNFCGGNKSSLFFDFLNKKYLFNGNTLGGFPFSSVRTTNATQFNSRGQLIWAPANLLSRSSASGAVLGVIGSGGSLPTGWTWASAGGSIVREVVGTGKFTNDDWYVDVRLYGTNGASVSNPHIIYQIGIPAVPGDRFIISQHTQIIAGSTTGIPSAARAVFSYNNPSYIGQNNTPSNQSTTSAQRLVGKESRAGGAIAGTTSVTAYAEFSINANETIDITVRIWQPQLERAMSFSDDPEAYVSTNGTAYYGERFNYDPQTLNPLGILVEPQSINYNRNSELMGGIAGTPGTAPTNWSITTVPGITITTSYGIEDGMNYIDVTYSGTNSSGAAQFPTISFDTAAAVAALNGETWTGGCYIRKISGADAESTWNTSIAGRNSSATLIAGQVATTTLSASGKLTTSRRVATFTFTDPTVAYVQHRMGRSLGIGEAMDITWRISAPQLEKLNFPTSYIPTYGTQVTRSADVLRTTSVESIPLSNGILYIDIDASQFPSVPSGTCGLVGAFDGTLNNRIQIAQNAGDVYGIVTQGGVAYSTGTNSPGGSVLTRKIALSYDGTIRRLTVNGNTPVTGVTAGFTGVTGINEFIIGAYTGGGNSFYGHVKEVRIYPSASVTDAQLQALTL